MIPQLNFDSLLKDYALTDKTRLLVSWYRQNPSRIHLPNKQVLFCFSSLDIQLSRTTIWRAKKLYSKSKPYTKRDMLEYWLKENSYFLPQPVSVIRDSLLSCGISADWKTIKRAKLNLLQQRTA